MSARAIQRSHSWRRALALTLACFVAPGWQATASAQLSRSAAPPTAAASAAPHDPFHRETPRSSVEGLLGCSAREDYSCFARYLQPVSGPDMDVEELMREF